MLLKVRREDFIPPEYRDFAYEEIPLPLPGVAATIEPFPGDRCWIRLWVRIPRIVISRSFFLRAPVGCFSSSTFEPTAAGHFSFVEPKEMPRATKAGARRSR